MIRKAWPNKITGPNAGGLRQFPNSDATGRPRRSVRSLADIVRCSSFSRKSETRCGRHTTRIRIGGRRSFSFWHRGALVHMWSGIASSQLHVASAQLRSVVSRYLLEVFRV